VKKYAWFCIVFTLQDKVVSSISELYSFMDGADATLALKVLGEVDENGEPVGGPDAEGELWTVQLGSASSVELLPACCGVLAAGFVLLCWQCALEEGFCKP
jgi:hypothetical protein